MSRNYEVTQQTTIYPQLGLLSSDAGSAMLEVDAPTTRQPADDGVIAQDEAYRIVQRLYQSPCDIAPQVVVFAGIDSGSGCSALCVRVAETLADHSSASVCVVDANLRAPSLDKYFRIENHYGLSNALTTRGEVTNFTRTLDRPNLHLISSGFEVAAPSRMLDSNVLKDRISELRLTFDYILIDSPPLNEFPEGTTLGRLSDGVVLILEANATRRETASKAVDNLRAAQVPILGAIFNKRTFPIPQALYSRL
jgi:capsular exopolysaccharide synthesis family protein